MNNIVLISAASVLVLIFVPLGIHLISCIESLGKTLSALAERIGRVEVEITAFRRELDGRSSRSID